MTGRPDFTDALSEEVRRYVEHLEDVVKSGKGPLSRWGALFSLGTFGLLISFGIWLWTAGGEYRTLQNEVRSHSVLMPTLTRALEAMTVRHAVIESEHASFQQRIGSLEGVPVTRPRPMFPRDEQFAPASAERTQ